MRQRNKSDKLLVWVPEHGWIFHHTSESTYLEVLRLIGGERKHSSALEHQATPMEDDGGGFNYSTEYPQSWPKGFTHMDKEGNMWSGNFQGFVQYRQLIPNESKRG